MVVFHGCLRIHEEENTGAESPARAAASHLFSPENKGCFWSADVTGAAVPVLQSEGQCGGKLSREKNGGFSFVSRYDNCYAQIEGYNVVIPLLAQLRGEERWFKVNISCPLIKRSTERTDLEPKPLPGTCDTPRALRVDCGHQGISIDACYKLGCCYDPSHSMCYYRLNACSLDGHFVFSVKTEETDPPINPKSLIIKDQPQCIPVITTSETAIFKIQVTDCGVKTKVAGEVLIYELEVEDLLAKGSDKHSPFSILLFSLQVQCEYEASDLKRAADLRSSYAVTNPPPVVSLGTFRVQMRIATDASFSSFFPEDQLPLTLPLRNAAYVEVSIAQPSLDPTLSLHVRDCFAYPASRHSVWTLLYDGCPNPLDNLRSSVPVDNQGKTTSHSQVRRFDVKTFAFLDPDSHPSVEEMYFYCWVEICTEDVDCAQECTIISSEGERQRREAIADLTQLVSFGPLLLGPNITEPMNDPCVLQRTMFQVTVYILSGVGAALLLILLFIVWSNIRKHRKRSAGLQQ
ncbi:zona pellucida sperm-binding protein 4-like [Aulostomus maculatus]